MTTYVPNPQFYPVGDVAYETTNEVLTAEIEDARQHLAKAIEAKGEDYVYIADTDATPSGGDSCLYLRYDRVEWDEGSYKYAYSGPKGPSCIVGHVMVSKEIPFDQIIPVEGDNAANALWRLGTYRSPIVREAICRAQAKQDHADGYTWGEAVEEFEAYIDNRTVKTDA